MSRPSLSALRVTAVAGICVAASSSVHASAIEDWTAGKTSAAGACEVNVSPVEIGHIAMMSCVGESDYQQQVAAALQSAPKKLLSHATFRIWSPSYADKVSELRGAKQTKVALSAFEASPRISEMLILRSELERYQAGGEVAANCPAQSDEGELAQLRAERAAQDHHLQRLREQRDILAGQLEAASGQIASASAAVVSSGLTCDNAGGPELTKLQAEHETYVSAYQSLSQANESTKAELEAARSSIPALKVEITRLTQESESLRRQLASKARSATSAEVRTSAEVDAVQAELQRARAAAAAAGAKLANAEEVIGIMASEMQLAGGGSSHTVARRAAPAPAPSDTQNYWTGTQPQPAVAYGSYMVEVGTGARAESADWNTVNSKVYARTVKSTRGSSRVIYAGPFNSRSSAQALADQLAKDSYRQHHVVPSQIVLPDAQPFQLRAASIVTAAAY